tara:strand:+ start:230 stop:400 length:171 start_codon:yes stop_codon:yes gene_type:complete
MNSLFQFLEQRHSLFLLSSAIYVKIIIKKDKNKIASKIGNTIKLGVDDNFLYIVSE